jgi:hypothetical protein
MSATAAVVQAAPLRRALSVMVRFCHGDAA